MGRGNGILFVYCHSERSEESPGRVAYRGVYIAVNCSNIKSVGFAFPGDVSLNAQHDKTVIAFPIGESIFQVSAYALTVSSSVTGFGLTFATTLLICFVENKNAATTTSIARSTSTKEL